MKKHKKHKIHKRITAGVLAAALFLTLPGMENMKVSAGQAEAQGTELSEAAGKVYSLYAGVDLKEAERTEFGTKNLIVSTLQEAFDSLGAKEKIYLGEGIYVLSYPDSESARTACAAYQGMEGIDFAEADFVVKVQTEEQQDGTTDESLVEKEEPEEEGNGKDDSIVKETEDKEDGTSGETADAQEESSDAEKEEDTKEQETGQDSGNDTEDAVAAEEAETGAVEDVPEETAEDDIIRVALLDTGIKSDIGNLASYIQETGINASGSGDMGNTIDDNGHGTAMAQVIVSALEENGKNADSMKILPVKVLDNSGYGTTLTAYLGMKAAMEQGADIICLGLSGKADSKLLERAVDEACNAGITVTGVAGNDASDVSEYVPGRYEQAVIISNAKNQEEAAEDSNYGDTVDFSAYGTRKVLNLSGEAQTVSGTSIACAYVTGVTASFGKGMSCKEMEAELLKRAVPVTEESLVPYLGKGIIGDVPEKEEVDKKEAESTQDSAGKDEVHTMEPSGSGTGKENASSRSSDRGIVKDAEDIENIKTAAYGVKAGDTVYCEKGTTPNVPAGCHAEKLTEFPCDHNNDSKTIASVWCELSTLYPTDEQLKANVRVSGGNDDVKLKVTGKLVDSCEGPGLTDGALFNKPDVPHRKLTVNLGNTYNASSVILARPAADNPALNPRPQGYAYFRYSYSFCKYTKLYYFVENSHYWLGDVAGTVGTPEYYPKEYSHTIVKYKIEKNSSSIRFNANGGIISDSPHKNGSTYYKLNRNGNVYSSSNKNGTYSVKKQKVTYGNNEINLYNVGTFGISREGYHLQDGKEWYATINGEKVYFDQNEVYKASDFFKNIKTKSGETITLKANWVKNTYTVKYNGNGATSGSTAASTHIYGTAKNLTVNGFKRSFGVTFHDNYDDDDTDEKTVSSSFQNWNTAAGGTGISYKDQKSVKNLTTTNGATVNLYAQWKDSTVTLPSRTREGYDLLGWSTNKNSVTADKGYTAGSKVTVSSNMNLYAVWKVKTYTIKYDANGGTGTMEDGTKTHFQAYTIKNNAFIREGYDFEGWSTKKEGPAEEKYAPGKTYDGKEDLTLYAIWKEHFNVAYIGNGQTQGTNFIDAGEDGCGHSEKLDYTFDDNQKDEEEENPEDYFQKAETVTYTDEETGETVKQEIEGTVVSWAMKSENAEETYNLGETTPGNDLINTSKEKLNITYGSPNSDFGKSNGIVADAMSSVRGASATSATIPSLGGVGTVYGSTPFVNMYAVWDMGPVIEAYDRYYTLEEAQGGFITEEELLNAAKATDEEVKSDSNKDGRLKNFIDEENQTKFTIMDYQAEEFTDLGGPAVISVTYRAEDAAGNVTKKMIRVHIIDGNDTVIDGHDIGTDPDAGKVRFISEKYLDTLDENSVWVKNDEYKAELAEVVSYKRSNPKQSDPVPLLGDDYTMDIPGTGTWNTTPQSVWTFTREQVKEAQQFVKDYGPSNYKNEDGLQKFYEKFAGCRQ